MSATTTTGATAVTGAMLAGVILWLCSLMHLQQPPVEVAGTIGAAILYGGHVLANWVNRRWPGAPEPVAAVVVTPAAVTPVTPIPTPPAAP